MDEVIACLAQEDWPLALVSLAAIATPQARSAWESAIPPSRQPARVEHWFKRLQRAPLPDRQEIDHEPLAVLSALDRLVAATRAPRFAATPLRAADRDWWLVPVTASWRRRARLVRQVGRLDHHLHHHAIVPAVLGSALAPLRVRCIALSGELANAVDSLHDAPDKVLRAWIAHFDDRCAVQWLAPQPAGRVVSAGIDPIERRGESWRRSLKQATDDNAFLWLAPELSLTPGQQDELVEALLAAGEKPKPRLVAPGSWHHPYLGGYANLASLIDGFTGEPLFRHQKLRCFGSYGNAGHADTAEDAIPGDEVTLLVTPLGNWTLLICKDFIDADESVVGLLQPLCADWVLVPSYGDDKTSDAQARRAAQVCRVEAACHALVATLRNCTAAADPAALPHLPGFCHRAGEDTPVRVGDQGGLVEIPLALDAQPPTLRLVRRSAY